MRRRKISTKLNYFSWKNKLSSQLEANVCLVPPLLSVRCCHAAGGLAPIQTAPCGAKERQVSMMLPSLPRHPFAPVPQRVTRAMCSLVLNNQSFVGKGQQPFSFGGPAPWREAIAPVLLGMGQGLGQPCLTLFCGSFVSGSPN